MSLGTQSWLKRRVFHPALVIYFLSKAGVKGKSAEGACSGVFSTSAKLCGRGGSWLGASGHRHTTPSCGVPLAPACLALKVLVLDTFGALARLCCLCLRACRGLPAARVWLFQRPWGVEGKLGAPFQLRLSPVKQATQQCQPVLTAALANLPGIQLTVLQHQPSHWRQALGRCLLLLLIL